MRRSRSAPGKSLKHCSGAQLRLENNRALICCEVMAGWPWRGCSLGLRAAAASGSVRRERTEAVQCCVGLEGGGSAQLVAGKKVLPVMKQSSSAALGNVTVAAAHRGGEDVVHGLAPSERHSGELATARAGRASLNRCWHLALAMQWQ
jgi:hypothetical protein